MEFTGIEMRIFPHFVTQVGWRHFLPAALANTLRCPFSTRIRPLGEHTSRALVKLGTCAFVLHRIRLQLPTSLNIFIEVYANRIARPYDLTYVHTSRGDGFDPGRSQISLSSLTMPRCATIILADLHAICAITASWTLGHSFGCPLASTVMAWDAPSYAPTYIPIKLRNRSTIGTS